jgi:hypothetical protein
MQVEAKKQQMSDLAIKAQSAEDRVSHLCLCVSACLSVCVLVQLSVRVEAKKQQMSDLAIKAQSAEDRVSHLCLCVSVSPHVCLSFRQSVAQ